MEEKKINRREEWSEALEKRVEERTKDLTQAQQATLNIMEDLEEARRRVEKHSKELEKKVKERTAQLAKTNKELEAFSEGLEEKVKERTFELSVLHQLSNAISYTRDYQELINIIMDFLYKIVDYDICASLIYSEHNADITVRSAYPQCSRFTQEVQNRLSKAVLLLTGEDIHKKKIRTFINPLSSDAELQERATAPISRSKPEQERDFIRTKSFFNVPFILNGEIFGMLNISSCKETLFSQGKLRILYTIANQASNAIERLRTIIKTEKSKMESMVEHMLEGVIMLDEQGEIVVLNSQARKILGFEDTQKVTGKDLYNKLRIAQVGKEKKKFWSSIGSSPVVQELVLPQGEQTRTLHCEAIPIKELGDKIVGISMILRDVTKEKRIEQMKNEFIFSVSHELKTPLAIIKEAVSLVMDEIPGKVVEAQRDVLVMAEANTLRLSKIIDSLLDISRLEAGKVQLNTQVVEINELITETVSDFKYRAEPKGISLDYEIPPVKVDISCDPDRIRQVLVNFLSNALKFTPRGGRTKVICNEEEDEVIVLVEDTGIGILKENIPKLFNRFVQINRELGPGEKGTGLGLAISKELVELHKGRIWAESKINKGSKFYFSLPKSNSEKEDVAGKIS